MRFFGRLLQAATLALFAAGVLRATTIVPPTFPELVAEADTIVRGKVLSVESRWAATPEGRVIKTYVTLSVLRTLKGTAGATLTLELLGGELDGQGMRVEGMPRFSVGDTDIVFVSGNGVRYSPLIGLMHGRYRVLTDPLTARDYIARNDRVPLASELDVRLPQEESLAATPRPQTIAGALSPAAFETKISAEIIRRASLP